MDKHDEANSRFLQFFTKEPKNVTERHHAWTINELYSADPSLASALEGRFVPSRDEQHTR
jgi:hypothetical protein